MRFCVWPIQKKHLPRKFNLASFLTYCQYYILIKVARVPKNKLSSFGKKSPFKKCLSEMNIIIFCSRCFVFCGRVRNLRHLFTITFPDLYFSRLKIVIDQFSNLCLVSVSCSRQMPADRLSLLIFDALFIISLSSVPDGSRTKD